MNISISNPVEIEDETREHTIKVIITSGWINGDSEFNELEMSAIHPVTGKQIPLDYKWLDKKLDETNNGFWSLYDDVKQELEDNACQDMPDE